MTTQQPAVADHPAEDDRPAVTPAVRALAIASLVSEIGIVVTGGAVRLTASGLGCPTWPRCTADSFISTPEMGVHGVIEFGNRLLTFVLTAVAIATLVGVWRLRRRQPMIFRLAVGLLAGIPAQAVIGGISVWMNLNPWIVGLHFIVSAVMVATATVLVKRTGRVRDAERGVARPASGAGRTLRQLAVAIAVFTGIAVYLGTIVTGTGPHAGDHGAIRHPFDPDIVTRLHAFPVYLLVASLVIATVLAFRRPEVSPRLRRALLIADAVTVLQAAIGFTQHFTGLPVLLVALHMLGACLAVAAATNIVDEVRARPVRSPVQRDTALSTR
ncbi:heme A synthase [Tersicoccus sp. Bi-70]|uniref:COX15/CtaA family protein n=1 Tax=Tersicoccus sp. Bi-70 TaxID=1897634 RepID=UPI000978127C|nr:COX15/CtaA family protein [Tersicoccus sp. Bi-70]OMH33060.1 cytochrome oxidase assembly protein [Tersicoccus sp. Bi-70]